MSDIERPTTAEDIVDILREYGDYSFCCPLIGCTRASGIGADAIVTS